MGLVNTLDAPDDVRTTGARLVKGGEDLNAHVMPLSKTDRRKAQPDLGESQKICAIFTEGSLSQLIDWNNVVAAGVRAPPLPL